MISLTSPLDSMHEPAWDKIIYCYHVRPAVCHLKSRCIGGARHINSHRLAALYTSQPLASVVFALLKAVKGGVCVRLRVGHEVVECFSW